MNVQQFLENLNERVSASASVKNVYGNPVVIGGRTVIPAAQVFYAFGGGGGSKSDNASGAGGGGNVAARPCGALEITAEGTRYIEFGSSRKLAGAIALGFVIGAAFASVRGPKRIDIKRQA